MSVASLLGCFSATIALAAAPETPAALAPTEVKATTATLHGVLNPGKEGGPFEVGTYEFVYRQSPTECKGAGEVKTPEGLSLGGGKEEVSQGIESLTANTQYTVCLIAHNEAKTETAVSPPVTFKTALPAETPETLKAEPVTARTATLHGVLNPGKEGNPGTYRFLYRESASECTGPGGKLAAEGAMSGGQAQAVEATATGLLPTTTYTFCLLARNEAGEEATGPAQTFTTLAAAPTISEESVSSAGSTEVTVSAQIDPAGAPTGYQVEYEPGVRTPEHSLPGSSVPVTVRQTLTGLQPSTEYHFRFVAHNTLGTAAGTDATFTTLGAGATAVVLPDNRAYELVSPLNSGEIYESQAGRESDVKTPWPSFRAAPSGEALAYIADPTASEGNGWRGNGVGNQWVARRTANGWQASDVVPAGEGETLETVSNTAYLGFSSDLSVGFLTATSAGISQLAQPQGPAGCTVLFSHTGSGGGVLSPLFTSPVTPGNCGRPLLAGASADGSKVFFQSEARLVPEAPEVPTEFHEPRELCVAVCDLYESVAGRVSLVNVLPDGTPAVGAVFGSLPLEETEDANRQPGLGNAVSADGSRAFWTDTQPGPDLGHIYLRVNGTTTLTVSAGAARYWTATPDGRYAFYTEGGSLWRFDSERGTREQLASEGAGVQGIVGASDDGSRVYFVAETALAPGAETRNCKSAEESKREATEKGPLTKEEEQRFQREIGEESGLSAEGKAAEGKLPAGRGCNLYFLHVGEPPKLVAALAAIDNQDIVPMKMLATGARSGDWQLAVSARTAEVAADGLSVVFESTHHLTGYDSRTLTKDGGGAPEVKNRTEVFIYQAPTGVVSCVSCSPTGAAPASEAGSPAVKESQGRGQTLPTHPAVFFANDTSLPHWLSADGSRVFFVSSQPLVPQDTNGLQDVYEWEREGAASCPAMTPARPDAGCVFLISGGQGADFSYLIDASASGNDVFFSTREQLLPQDRNTLTNVYDARVGGGFPEFSTACTGTGCQGVPPGSPPFATPSSTTFNGTGNYPPQPAAKGKTAAQLRAEKLAKALTSCRKRYKHSKHRRASCERKARKQFGATASAHSKGGRK